MYHKVVHVEPLENYQILLDFDNGERKVFDVSPFLNLKIFGPLKEESVFNTVKISFDTIEWANGADFDPEFLYEESKSLESISS